MTATLLTIDNLSVRFGENQAAKGISFSLAPGEILALVGESGSGKSVTALSILDLVQGGNETMGTITFKETNLRPADEEVLRPIRGNQIAMIFQEPMSALNPVHRIGQQIAESLVLHQNLPVATARERVLQLLEDVGLDRPELRAAAYPHELSGGQLQRAMIAMALANSPDLLIADEPTTALDATIRLQILDLLCDLRKRTGMAMLFISHDLAQVARIADRVAVMQQGQIVEIAPVKQLFSSPQHPYSQTLINTRLQDRLPSSSKRPQNAEKESDPLLSVENLRVWYPVKSGVFGRVRNHIKAVDGVSLDIAPAKTIGIVGESGSGKSSLALALLRLIKSTGTIRFQDQSIQHLSLEELQPLRQKVQIVFQDPYASLSPRLTIADIVGEGLLIHHPGLPPDERTKRICRALADAGMESDILTRYPHEFSGGQRQRISIARALAVEPVLLVLDEPTSALDVQTQAQILALFAKLQHERGLSYILISHDLAVIRALADHILIMKDGEIVEEGESASILGGPQTDYAKALLNAALI